MDKEKLFRFCFGCLPSEFPEAVILAPYFLAGSFGSCCEVMDVFKGRLYSVVFAEKDGAKIAVVQCGIGDRLSGDAVLLLGISPVKRMIFTGTCGGLRDCGIGDMVVCDNAFNGEGFGRYHGRSFDIKEILDNGEMVSADPGYTGRLKRFLSEGPPDRTLPVGGNIFTIGSLMAENIGNLSGLRKRGFKGIDMELSAVYKAALSAGIKAAGLVLVSDLPIERPLWEEALPPDKDKYNRGVRDLVNSAASFAAMAG